MLHRSGDFEEWQLAEVAKRDIPFYLKKGNTVCYVPYIDDPTGEKKFIKYVWLNEQWIYADNSQFS
jgi:hypothetical protein